MWTHLGSGRCLNFLGFEGGAYRRQCRMITIDIVRLEEYDEAKICRFLLMQMPVR